MVRVSDEELARALAENLDEDGNDVGLERLVASWTDEERAAAEANLRRCIDEMRRTMRSPVSGGDPTV